MQTENLILKEEALAKDALSEANLGRINGLEENLKKSVNRVNLLEPWAKGMKHKVQHLENNKNVNVAVDKNHENSTDVNKLKLEVKSKNQEIKLLNEHKNTLANELRDLQEKSIVGQKNKDVIDTG